MNINILIFPDLLHLLFKAFVDLVKALKWKSFVVLYEDSEGLVRLQEVLKLSPNQKDVKITIRQLIAGPGDDYR